MEKEEGMLRWYKREGVPMTGWYWTHRYLSLYYLFLYRFFMTLYQVLNFCSWDHPYFIFTRLSVLTVTVPSLKNLKIVPTYVFVMKHNFMLLFNITWKMFLICPSDKREINFYSNVFMALSIFLKERD